MPSTDQYKKSEPYKKLRKATSIEQNWNSDPQNTVPLEIRPRARLGRGKAVIGSIDPEAPWQDWSFGLLHELERLSSMTIGKLAFAQELMLLEVKQRQQDIFAKNHSVLEILVSDLEKINRDLAQSRLDTTAVDDLGDVDDEENENEDDEDDEDDKDNDGKHNAMDEARNPPLTDYGDSPPESIEDDINHEHDAETGTGLSDIKIEPNEIDTSMHLLQESKAMVPRSQSVRRNGISKPPHGSKASGQGARLKKDLKDKARIANLFAEAMRLKQEAAKREAEAYELQAKMLMAEAKELE